MKSMALLWMLFWVPSALHAQESTVHDFVAGGAIRLHLKSGGYTITSTDKEKIVVSCQTDCGEHDHVRVKITSNGSNADVYVSETPRNNFRATIEVPARSDLWVRLSAGEMVVEAVEGNKDIEALAGRIQIDVPHPEEYGSRDASVATGSIKSSAFDVSKGGLFRSFQQHGPGKYRLHAHLMTGEIDLRGSN